ncbi:MAG: hypothetical protein IJX84_07830 [Clostridia bacterium]|nr:hypothetical protein [Clostridia bacterium]
MKQLSLFALVLISVLCLATCGMAEGVSTPTDVECEHSTVCTNVGYCVYCGEEYDYAAAGQALGHPSSAFEIGYDDNNCWEKCTACGEIFRDSTHVATCKDKTHCFMCGADYSGDIVHREKVECNPEKHWVTCEDCGEYLGEGTHYSYCTDSTGACAVCGMPTSEVFHSSWTASIAQPTCELDGSIVEICDFCYVEVGRTILPATGHAWELTDEVEASCTVAGYKEYTCATCSQTKKDTLGQLLHNYEFTIERMMHIGACSMCGEEGDRGQHFGHCTSPTVCAVCGASAADVEIAFVSHEYNTDTFEHNDTEHWITCHGCGEKTSCGEHWTVCTSPNSCMECGATGVTIDVGHMNEFIVDETTHQSKCINCGELGEVELHEAFCWDTEHCYGCDSDGVTMSKFYHYTREMQYDENVHWEYCDGCEQEISEREAHYDDCTKPDGKCDVCEAPCGEDVLNHVWKESSVVEATCTTDGVRTETCERCNGTREVTTAAAKGHTWGEPVIVEATCTTDGSKTTTCAVCGEKIVEAVKATGEHTWGAPVIVAATCTVDGSTTTICSACGEKLVETIVAEGHTEGMISGNAATCTGTGLTDGKICSVCGVVIAEQNVIPAKGHNRVKDEGVEPTADTDGLTEGYHCSRCGAVLVKQEIIPAVGSASVPMTELEIFLDQMLEENEHDNRGDNVPNNGKDFEIPLTKSSKEDKGIVLHVYRENNETYNAVGLSVSFKEDVTEEISSVQDQVTSISELKNEEKIAGFVEYVRSLVVTLSPEQLEADATDELVLEILKNITITDEDFGDLIEAFVDGKLDIDRRTVIRDGYEYFLVSDGKTLSLSVRKIEK